MTDDRSLERAARSWLEEGPITAPDRPVEAALARIQTIPQERDLRVPWIAWRPRTMFGRLLVAVLSAFLAVGTLALGASLIATPDDASVAPTTATPTIAATSPAPTPPPPSHASSTAITIGRFVPVGSLVVGRAWHSALELSDGRVLLVGGEGSHVEHAGNALDSIEVWDPIGVAFTASGQMQRATYGDQFSGPHAFEMTDGRVLLIPAGCVCGPAPASTPAQVWDPVSGPQPLETLTIRRVAYTATQLADGRILIAGGVPGLVGDEIAAAEVWDPLAETIESAGTLSFARADAVATLLTDGRVLIIGGAIRSDSATGVTAVGEAEIWDPVSGTFSTAFTLELGPGGSLGADRQLFAITLRDGRVLLLDDAGARVWDPIASTVSEAGTFREERREFSATLLLDGRVLVAGGSNETLGDGRASVASTELWDPATSGFVPGPELMERRAGHSATLLSDGRVLIVGGFRTAGLALDALASAELWEPVPAGGQ